MNDFLRHEEIEAIKKDILSSFHCALPGIVESFDAENQAADIRPAAWPKAGGIKIPLPLLKDVPVFIPHTGTEPAWTVSPGDACLLVFADYPIDPWLEDDATAPVPDRQHDLSDAFAFIGFQRKTKGGDDS